MSIRDIIARLIRSKNPKHEAKRIAQSEQRKQTDKAFRKVTKR